MFCSTGTHKVRCNGAATKRRWWIVAADHTTKSSKLLSQYMNCFSFALDKLNHCLALTGMSLKKLSPGNFAKLHWPDCDVPGWRTKRSRAFAWNVRDLSMSAAITGRGWTLRADARKPKSRSSKRPIILHLELSLLSAWLADRWVLEQVRHFDLSQQDWLMLDYPMVAGGYLFIVLGFGTGKAPLSLADTQRGKYIILKQNSR